MTQSRQSLASAKATLPMPFTVLFCTVLWGISLVLWEGRRSDHVDLAFLSEHDIKKTQETIFRPAGLSRYRRSGEKNRRVSQKRIHLHAGRGSRECHVRPKGRREIVRREWVGKGSRGRDVWPG